MPGFQNVFLSFRDKGFTIIAVAMNDNNPSSLVKELNILFPVVIPNEQVSRDYGNIAHIPISFLIGKDGRIIKKVIGLYTETDLRNDVELALKGQKQKRIKDQQAFFTAEAGGSQKRELFFAEATQKNEKPPL